MYPFSPAGAAQSVSATGTSASVSIAEKSLAVRISNTGTTNIGNVLIGEGAQTAAATNTPILPGESIILMKGDGADTVAYFSASGTTLVIQPVAVFRP